MRIKRARIQNFRCLEDVDIAFDSVTTFIGPNGVGKSTVLRALDWFFNGGELTEEDVLHGASRPKIMVEVEFDRLSETDRNLLGKYAPQQSDTVTIWRTWEDFEQKITGKALAYFPFEEVRALEGASLKRKRYHELRSERPDLGLPSAASAQAAEEAMTSWERGHPEELQDAEVSDNHFFGFTGQGLLSDLFDYVLVAADLRAGEEAQDGRSSLLARIVALSIDRSSADEELMELAQKHHEDQKAAHHRHFKSRLDQISKDLTEAVRAFAAGRSIKVSTFHADPKPPKVQFSVGVVDNEITTRMELQGHGFQRAVLIAALKHLAEHGAASSGICLAIEEPELYQHPIQAGVFASVLRKLAQGEDQRIQVTYATHSPMFVEPHHFSQIRRVSRGAIPGSARRSVAISHATEESIIRRLHGFIKEESVKKQMSGVCLNRLPEALFANAAVLVEGTTDRAVLEGCAEHDDQPLALDGIAVADVGGKSNLLLPHAILTLLGIPCYVVFDGDGDCVPDQASGHARENRTMFRYLERPEEEWPTTNVSQSHAVFAVTLEHELETMWPAWGNRCAELVNSGAGFPQKNASTYHHAAMTVQDEVPETLTKILTAVRAMCGEATASSPPIELTVE